MINVFTTILLITVSYEILAQDTNLYHEKRTNSPRVSQREFIHHPYFEIKEGEFDYRLSNKNIEKLSPAFTLSLPPGGKQFWRNQEGEIISLKVVKNKFEGKDVVYHHLLASVQKAEKQSWNEQGKLISMIECDQSPSDTLSGCIKLSSQSCKVLESKIPILRDIIGGVVYSGNSNGIAADIELAIQPSEEEYKELNTPKSSHKNKDFFTPVSHSKTNHELVLKIAKRALDKCKNIASLLTEVEQDEKKSKSTPPNKKRVKEE